MVETTKHLKHPKVQGQICPSFYTMSFEDGVRTACCGGLGCDQGGGNFLEKTSDGRLGRKVGSDDVKSFLRCEDELNANRS